MVRIVPTYNLGLLTITRHDVEKITDALGIPEYRFEDIVDIARRGWQHGDTISESIEFIAQRLVGSELVLAMIILGRVWEQNKRD